MDTRERRGLRLVSTVVRAFARQTLDYELLLPAIARAIARAIPDSCLVTLCYEDCTTLTPVAMHDDDQEITAQIQKFRGSYQRSDTPFAAQVIATGSMLQPTADLDAIATRNPRFADLLRAVGGRGFVIVPMRVGADLFGVITIVRRRAEHPPLDELDVEIVEDLASHAALAISNARLIAKARNDERASSTRSSRTSPTWCS